MGVRNEKGQSCLLSPNRHAGKLFTKEILNYTNYNNDKHLSVYCLYIYIAMLLVSLLKHIIYNYIKYMFHITTLHLTFWLYF